MAKNKVTNGSKNSSGVSSKTGIAILGGLAVAAAAGAYFIHGNKAVQRDIKKKVKSVKGWALKAKGEVMQKIENLKAIDEELYNKAIDAVMKKYENVKNIDTSEVVSVAKELKSHWKNIKKELGVGTKIAKKTAKKVAKVATKVASDAKTAVTK